MSTTETREVALETLPVAALMDKVQPSVPGEIRAIGVSLLLRGMTRLS